MKMETFEKGLKSIVFFKRIVFKMLCFSAVHK